MPEFDVANRLKPILKWAGGKGALLPQIVSLFPREFDRYVEPFVGGGAVFFALKGAVPAVINDANPELVGLYGVVRDEPNALMDRLDALARRYSERFFYELRAAADLTCRIEAAARTVFLNKAGFNGLYRQNARGEFNVPFGKRIACPGLYDRENILLVSEHLKGCDLRNEDFERVIDTCGAGDFVYCDPPYEPLSATSSFNAYKAGGFDRAEQQRLKAACERAAGRGARIAVSNSSASFILELYEHADINVVTAKRAINSNGALRGAIDEVLVRMG